jgi:hypothetical protein
MKSHCFLYKIFYFHKSDFVNFIKTKTCIEKINNFNFLLHFLLRRAWTFNGKFAAYIMHYKIESVFVRMQITLYKTIKYMDLIFNWKLQFLYIANFKLLNISFCFDWTAFYLVLRHNRMTPMEKKTLYLPVCLSVRPPAWTRRTLENIYIANFY